ncbi:MAG: hypothetical protein JRF42_06890 [Deltaproteobacteria bacterium]|nr:hypothetical protein [Deltaproteobacteria bacterium]
MLRQIVLRVIARFDVTLTFDQLPKSQLLDLPLLSFEQEGRHHVLRGSEGRTERDDHHDGRYPS